MINYRNIFNPTYNYIGIIIIIILVLIIIGLQKDVFASIKHISKTVLISGLIILIFTLLLNFIMEFLIIGGYKIFIQIITDNIISNLYFYSITLIIISSSINLLIRVLPNPKKID